MAQFQLWYFVQNPSQSSFGFQGRCWAQEEGRKKQRPSSWVQPGPLRPIRGFLTPLLVCLSSRNKPHFRGLLRATPVLGKFQEESPDTGLGDILFAQARFYVAQSITKEGACLTSLALLEQNTLTELIYAVQSARANLF